MERLLLIKIILDGPLTSTFLFKILSRKTLWWKRLTVSSLRRKSCKNYHRACDSFPNVHSGHYLTLTRALWNSLGTERGERLWGHAAGSLQNLNPELLTNPRMHTTVGWCLGRQSTSTQGSFSDMNTHNRMDDCTIAQTGLFQRHKLRYLRFWLWEDMCSRFKELSI